MDNEMDDLDMTGITMGDDPHISSQQQ
jgi:hypothetical protein